MVSQESTWSLTLRMSEEWGEGTITQVKGKLSKQLLKGGLSYGQKYPQPPCWSIMDQGGRHPAAFLRKLRSFKKNWKEKNCTGIQALKT